MSLCLDKNQNEVSYFVADSIDIIWDYPNDSPKNIQYKDVFLSKGLDIFFHPELKDPKEILNFSDGYFLPDSSGTRKLYENGFNVRFGPSRCFDKCAWYNFSFRRKGDSYELVGVFLDG